MSVQAGAGATVLQLEVTDISVRRIENTAPPHELLLAKCDIGP